MTDLEQSNSTHTITTTFLNIVLRGLAKAVRCGKGIWAIRIKREELRTLFVEDMINCMESAGK